MEPVHVVAALRSKARLDRLDAALQPARLRMRGIEGVEGIEKVLEECAAPLVVLDADVAPAGDLSEWVAGIRRAAAPRPLRLHVYGANVDYAVEEAWLRAGADGILPCADRHPDVLRLRIQAALRYTGVRPDGLVLEHGPLRLDLVTREAAAASKLLDLRPRQFDVLAILARRAGEIVSREELGLLAGDGITDTTAVHIHGLRQGLGKYRWMVETVRGKGYRLRTEP